MKTFGEVEDELDKKKKEHKSKKRETEYNDKVLLLLLSDAESEEGQCPRKN